MKRWLILFLLLIASFTACRQEGKHVPLIGISCGHTSMGADYLSYNYSSAVERSGGLPVIFPTVLSPETAAALAEKVDAFIFSGGPDLDPRHYGETIWNETVEIDPVRDSSDLLLMKAALASGKPVMAICRGEQLMNVVLGGSLYQDIPTQVEGALVHGGGSLHRIGVEKGSVLYELFGQDSLTVNSTHHQAVKAAAPGVRVTARSSDGIVEAYEVGNQVVAFQFHPEGLARTDESWLRPFQYLVKKAKKR